VNDVFLTGATGFVGSFLLAELVDRTTARVHCLVRCATAAEGRARIEAAFAAARPGRPLPAGRLVAVGGDLARPLLGLDQTRFHALAGTVEALYHCGAQVNFVYPYATLKQTNVLGTQEVLRLASVGRPKPLHHVSTLRVLGSFAGMGGTPAAEDDPLDHDAPLLTGYGQSKWVAEKLVRLAQDRGLGAAVYRPGMVTGHTRTGVSNRADLLCRMIKGCVQLGAAPLLDMTVDATPVDFVAAAIVALSRRPSSLGRRFHLVTTDPVPWNTIAEWVRAFGYPLRALPYDDWRRLVVAAAERSTDNALAPLVHFFVEGAPLAFAGAFDCRHARAGLAGTGVTCPPASAALLATYLAWFVESGFLPPPGRAAAAVQAHTAEEVPDGAR
jgi:myxalamid-type nonribosomal peptide synthetase MxaA